MQVSKRMANGWGRAVALEGRGEGSGRRGQGSAEVYGPLGGVGEQRNRVSGLVNGVWVVVGMKLSLEGMVVFKK